MAVQVLKVWHMRRSGPHKLPIAASFQGVRWAVRIQICFFLAVQRGCSRSQVRSRQVARSLGDSPGSASRALFWASIFGILGGRVAALFFCHSIAATMTLISVHPAARRRLYRVDDRADFSCWSCSRIYASASFSVHEQEWTCLPGDLFTIRAKRSNRAICCIFALQSIAAAQEYTPLENICT